MSKGKSSKRACLPSRIGAEVKCKMPPNNRLMDGVIEDEIRWLQSNFPDKEFRVQLIKFRNGRTEVRIGYYIIGKKKGALGRWVWGQFTSLMPLADVAKLIDELHRQGWLDKHKRRAFD